MEPDYQKELDGLLETIKKHSPGAKLSLAEEAFWLSKSAHEAQKRESGEPYFSHPMAVAKMLAEKGLNEVVIAAALLHDVLEDTKIGKKEFENKFGHEVYSLVEGVTNVGIATFKSKQEHSAANIIKTIMASAKDVRVLVIKLFDKLHNMRTIWHLPKERQKRIAADALTIYVPLAHQLGMHEMKYEMEDLCFRTLEPENYKKMEAEVKAARGEKAKEIRDAIAILRKKYPEMKWYFEEKRKSIYSVYSKMIAQDKQLKEINDTLILKIVVHDKDECYMALGKVHGAFKPIPKKMKDFIAIPEYLIYQSLHTQVIGPRKKPLKVYIFCNSMNNAANNGVMSLLRPASENKEMLKEYGSMFSKISSPKAKDSREIAETLNLDFNNRAMVIFTSEGNAMNLPIGSTATDFAFYHDGKKAHYASKAEVNGKITPLWTKLSSGDRVKIFYAFTKQFNSSWLGYASTEKVRKMIERELEKKGNVKGAMRVIKVELEAMDRQGLLADQSAIIANCGLDMEAINALCSTEKKTCRTEIFIRNSENHKVQKIMKRLRDMEETLNLKLDYLP